MARTKNANKPPMPTIPENDTSDEEPLAYRLQRKGKGKAAEVERIAKRAVATAISMEKKRADVWKSNRDYHSRTRRVFIG